MSGEHGRDKDYKFFYCKVCGCECQGERMIKCECEFRRCWLCNCNNSRR